MGMGWNIVTGTIDLGLEVFDVLILLGDWIRNRKRTHATKLKAEEILRKGKRRRPEPRSIKLSE